MLQYLSIGWFLAGRDARRCTKAT